MKGKTFIGVFMVVLCVASYFLYSSGGSKVKNEGTTQTKPNTIEGVVVSKTTDKPISGVSIAKRGFNPSEVTDDNGYFSMEGKQSDELILKKEGYVPIIVEGKDAGKIIMFPVNE